ncbi:hypothetical protein [uncultured Draconibacterium sp.]|uniref:hypothetical protein n=1 Tax=uncultured Draconibacterium sp. TaxID=1573823 RepID=UPI0025D8857B|nr:hypothetical protein [uncultured Draconibacterium sp.]
MKLLQLLSIIVFAFCVACNSEVKNYEEGMQDKPASELVFDKTKWQTKEGRKYPYRDKIVNDLVYNDTIRTLQKPQILDLLGEPDRSNENYIYYLIKQERLIFWPLHSKFMVVKFTDDSSVEWIRIHQ